MKNTNRKELTDNYKRTVQPMGIYRITNTANGKVFIGSALDLRSRMNRHRFQLENGLHPNREMQSDFNQVGEKSFTFEVIDRLEPKEEPGIDYSEELDLLEAIWLEKLSPFAPKGYNKQQ